MKIKILLSALLLSSAAMTATAANVRVVSGNITYNETVGDDNIKITFQKCMFNSLYTFKDVSLNGIALNSTSSDNIGPFNAGGQWMGGNHGYPGQASTDAKTAKTISYKIYADETAISNTGYHNVDCKILTVEVENEIYYHKSITDAQRFCIEKIKYVVSGNSIEVFAEHTYDMSLAVARYYGMQSMFNNETALLTPGGALTPGGKLNTWTSFTPVGDTNKLDLIKKNAPGFTTMIEKNNNGYQAAYMTKDGLGDRSRVGANDIIFTGNNWSKAYQVLMYGSASVKAGETTTWHGIYSWFKEPLTDTCDGTNPEAAEFEYLAYVNGQPKIMHVGADGSMTETAGINDITADRQPIFANAVSGGIVINETAPNARIYNISGSLVHSGDGSFYCPAGIYIATDGEGHSIKLLVK